MPAPALFRPEIRINAAPGQKLFMSSRLGHPAVLQHNDVVRAHNGLKPVGNDDDRLFRYQSGDRLLDQYLILRVEGCGCLVQQDDGRILQKRPCNRNALLLTAGECRAALSHDGLVAIGKAMMKSWQAAAFAASMISSMVASGFPIRMLASIES